MMKTAFQVSGLSAAQFAPLFGLSDDELRARGVIASVADARPGYPCRVSLAEAEIAERVLLVNYEHQPADTPYRSAHAIFVREGATETRPRAGEVPEVLRTRLLSIRSFDTDGLMLDADVVDGSQAAQAFDRFFDDPSAAYLHVHNAKRGCYAARVDRAVDRESA